VAPRRGAGRLLASRKVEAGRAGSRYPLENGNRAIKQAGSNLAEAFAVDRAAFRKAKLVAQQLARIDRQVNSVGQSGRLHPVGEIDGRPPQIVRKFLAANDPGDHRPGVDADSNRHGGASLAVEIREGCDHFQRHFGYGFGVIGSGVGQSANDQVAVADRLDLFETVDFGDPVKARKKVIEQRDQFLGIGVGREFDEFHDVGKKHGHAGVTLGDGAFALLQPIGDRHGQDVKKQSFRFLPLDLEQLFFLLQFDQPQPIEIAQAFPIKRGGDPGGEKHRIYGLREEILGAQFNAAHNRIQLVESGRDDYWNMVAGRVLLDFVQHVVSAHPRHIDVEDDEVKFALPQQIEGDLAIAGLSQVVIAKLAEDEADDAAQGFGIVGDQDGSFLAALGRFGDLQSDQFFHRGATRLRLLEKFKGSGLVVFAGYAQSQHASGNWGLRKEIVFKNRRSDSSNPPTGGRRRGHSFSGVAGRTLALGRGFSIQICLMEIRSLVRVVLVAGGVLLASWPVGLLGFGRPGHEWVGAIADTQLKSTPATLVPLKKIIGKLTLEQLAPLPDAIRSWDNLPDDQKALTKVSQLTDPKGRLVAADLPAKIRQQLWDFFRANQTKQDGQARHHVFHFDDLALADGVPLRYTNGAIGTDPQDDLVNTIAYCFHVLHHDASPDPLKRKITPAIAVILLAHMVGDLHQPMHVGTEYYAISGTTVTFVDPSHVTNAKSDRGGNSIAVRVPGPGQGHPAGPSRIPGANEENLHSVWDDDAVDKAMVHWRTQFHLASNSPRAGLLATITAGGPEKGWLPQPGAVVDDVVRDWATEIMPLAKEAHARLTFAAYPAGVDNPKFHPIAVTGVRPGEDYLGWAGARISDELLRGGYRLAWLIQEALTVKK